MENFEFYNPTKIIFGRNTIKQIGEVINEFGYKKIMLLAGGGSIKKNGVYNKVVKSLRANDIDWIEVWGVRPNPVLSKVREAIEIAKRSNVEALLAVGGGSVIDSAKAICAGVYLDDIWLAFEDKVKIKKALPLFTVLTLSGTASEMNQWAVITNEDGRKKWSIGSSALFPRVSIIDPEVQFTLPWNQTVNGAIDALAHIMENYFLGSVEEASLSICEALMRTIIKMVDKLKKDEKDYNSRANLIWCATMAHNGILGQTLKGGDWSSHRIEHGISALHPEVAHGAGLAIVFPSWIKYMKNYNPDIFKRFAKEVWNEKNIDKAVEKMKMTFKKWGAPSSLRDLGIRREEIKDIAENASKFRILGRLKKLNKKDIEKILTLAY